MFVFRRKSEIITEVATSFTFAGKLIPITSVLPLKVKTLRKADLQEQRKSEANQTVLVHGTELIVCNITYTRQRQRLASKAGGMRWQ